jgi:peptidoglycan/LPS O-acetylase OafA/YrhL
MGAIRLFLALAVYQSHVTTAILGPAGRIIDSRIVAGVNGGFAVMLFFVISGFLISFVLEQKYDRPGGTAAFYRARALRIYPLWWCFYLLVPVVIYGSLWAFVASRHVYDLIAGFFLFGSDLMLSFWHYPHRYSDPMPQGLELGWTLASEMTFYLLAPLILRSKVLPVAILAASAALRLILNLAFPFAADLNTWVAWCYCFFPSVVMFFMLGHLARQLHKVAPLPPSIAWSLLGAAAVALMIQDGGGPENTYFYGAVLLFAAALPAIFDATKDNRICNFLGDLTYPLYLSSGPLLVLLQMPDTFIYGIGRAITATGVALPGATMWLQAAFISVALWLLVIPVAATVHFFIEKPATACLRAALSAFDRKAQLDSVELAAGAPPGR